MSTLNQVLKHKRKLKKRRSKSPSLGKNPQKKGVCVKVYTTSPKKPNSAVRKVAKIRLSTGRKVIVGIPGQGHNVKVNTPVMIRGGRINDVPGVRYKIIRGKLGVNILENFTRVQKRSKYNLPRDNKLHY